MARNGAEKADVGLGFCSIAEQVVPSRDEVVSCAKGEVQRLQYMVELIHELELMAHRASCPTLAELLGVAQREARRQAGLR